MKPILLPILRWFIFHTRFPLNKRLFRLLEHLEGCRWRTVESFLDETDARAHLALEEIVHAGGGRENVRIIRSNRTDGVNWELQYWCEARDYDWILERIYAL